MASPTHGTSASPPRRVSGSESKDLNKLRRILLAPEQSQLENIQKKIEDLVVDEQSVGRVLPNAILLRSKQDTQLAKSLAPILEDGFKHSIEKSPHKIADAISPIMAPAIRQAILNALRGMVQSLNQTLEHSVSWNGLQWRVEALRTGRPFAEVILLHTLRYRVEQVFLIHRESGLLLQHVSAEVETIQDEEVVSGMLTAIQDFVRDSFGGSQSDALESFRVGELTVWIEQGPQAILAGVIRGNPPLELRGVFQQVLEEVHIEFAEELLAVTGDQGQFENTRPHLEGCLQAQFEGRSSTPSPFLWGMLVFLCVGLIVWGGWAYFDHQRWMSFLQQTKAEPGIVVTSVDKSNGKHTVNGLRDPLSVEPTELAKQAGLNVESIRFQFKPYFAVSSQFLEMRLRARLQPPDSVNINVKNTVLVVSGEASHQWVNRLENIQYITPGITTIDSRQLIDTDVARFETLRGQVEAQHFFFAKGSSRFLEGKKDQMVSLTRNLRELDILAVRLAQMVRVEIRGQTSQDGSRLRNKQIRLARADAVQKALSIEGLKRITVVPAGFDKGVSDQANPDPAAARQVSFKVFSESLSEGRKGSLE